MRPWKLFKSSLTGSIYLYREDIVDWKNIDLMRSYLTKIIVHNTPIMSIKITTDPTNDTKSYILVATVHNVHTIESMMLDNVLRNVDRNQIVQRSLSLFIENLNAFDEVQYLDLVRFKRPTTNINKLISWCQRGRRPNIKYETNDVDSHNNLGTPLS